VIETDNWPPGFGFKDLAESKTYTQMQARQSLYNRLSVVIQTFIKDLFDADQNDAPGAASNASPGEFGRTAVDLKMMQF